MQSLCYRFFFSINSVMYEAWQIITTDNININIFSHNNVISGYDFLRSLPNVSELTKRRSEMTKRQIYIYTCKQTKSSRTLYIVSSPQAWTHLTNETDINCMLI